MHIIPALLQVHVIIFTVHTHACSRIHNIKQHDEQSEDEDAGALKSATEGLSLDLAGYETACFDVSCV